MEVKEKKDNWLFKGLVIAVLGGLILGFITDFDFGFNRNSSPEAMAKTYIKCMIKGDEENLDKINKSSSFSYPTSYIISYYAPEYSGYSVSDFDITVYEGSDYEKLTESMFMVYAEDGKSFVAVKSKDGRVKDFIEVANIGGKYFITNFHNWPDALSKN